MTLKDFVELLSQSGRFNLHKDYMLLKLTLNQPPHNSLVYWHFDNKVYFYSGDLYTKRISFEEFFNNLLDFEIKKLFLFHLDLFS